MAQAAHGEAATRLYFEFRRGKGTGPSSSAPPASNPAGRQIAKRKRRATSTARDEGDRSLLDFVSVPAASPSAVYAAEAAIAARVRAERLVRGEAAATPAMPATASIAREEEIEVDISNVGASL